MIPINSKAGSAEESLSFSLTVYRGPICLTVMFVSVRGDDD